MFRSYKFAMPDNKSRYRVPSPVNNIIHRLCIPFRPDTHITTRITRPSDNTHCYNMFHHCHTLVNTHRWVCSCSCQNKNKGSVLFDKWTYLFHRTVFRSPCRRLWLPQHKRKRPYLTTIGKLYRKGRSLRRQTSRLRRPQRRCHIHALICIRCHRSEWFARREKFVLFP